VKVKGPCGAAGDEPEEPHEPETLHPRFARRATLTAAPRAFPLLQRKALRHREGPGTSPAMFSSIYPRPGNPSRMAGPLVRFEGPVKAREGPAHAARSAHAALTVTRIAERRNNSAMSEPMAMSGHGEAVHATSAAARRT